MAATGARIFRITDGGTTWTKTYTGPGRVQDLQARPENFNRMIAGVNGEGILVSDDAGASWRKAPAIFLGAFRRIELAYSLSHPNIAYASVEGAPSQLMRSDDGALSWIPTFDNDAGPVDRLGGQGWYDNTIAVHPFNPDTVFVGGILLHRIRMDDGLRQISAPVNLDWGGTGEWLVLINFGASAFGGLVS